MKKIVLWIMLTLISVVVLSLVLSGCFMMGPGFQVVTSGASVSGHISGITNNATVTIKDDLGESTTAGPHSSYNPYYYNGPYHYNFSVKPGVRTLTYSCTGYATVATKISVIGQTTVNVTMIPITTGGASK